MKRQNYPVVHINWNPAYRIIPTRYPAINVFDRVASAVDFDALFALEGLTNDHMRNELGQIELVPPEERLFGLGTGPIMSAFTHPNPQGSRFSDGSYGVFYCAHDKDTSIAETAYHSALFMRATLEPPMRLQMRLYTVRAKGEITDLRDAIQNDQALVHPDRYAHAQAVGRRLREEGVNGAVYPSVRRPGGECLAAFRPRLLSHCMHKAYYEYEWNGETIIKSTQIGKQ
ncbi:MAG TPA: RES family NAD+ phosphorylase [Rhodocyclaceae bacterium]|nr:RES family NAD+ phosphorylase [Rhodocyclaceae bacterium]